ncbi:MAG: dynamin family protein [Gammaproteobacteria bacterium]|nr:dynamin family protein [Gammaproteobacteria bacterium]
MTQNITPMSHRLDQLEEHLKTENPVLLETIKGFRQLDRVGHKLGLLADGDSFATQITWWPLISVLGTFSAGKSTFINHFIGHDLQRSGNQAVDDMFTVICYNRQQAAHALPGVALDSDPRFPFYRISDDIEEAASGEGTRVDAYLQLKTTPSENLRGKILIDSPGFDADAQRTATLRITDHIIDLSDLVLVFFDARHPEPGAMRDTLDHLVSSTIKRSDSGKFLYILNQMDTAAREDNTEEIVAAWQRALGERGLTAGRFYTIYNPDAATPITDDALRERFEAKRDHDMNEIHSRMHQVEVQRAYRVVASLENTARDIETKAAPALKELLVKWRERTLLGDTILFGLVIVLYLGWNGLSLTLPFVPAEPPVSWIITLGLLFVVLLGAHFVSRNLAAMSLTGAVHKAAAAIGDRLDLVSAFRKSTSAFYSIFLGRAAGWGPLTRRRLSQIRQNTDNYVQKLNDRFTNPSGQSQPVAPQASPAASTPVVEPVEEAAPDIEQATPQETLPAEDVAPVIEEPPSQPAREEEILLAETTEATPQIEESDLKPKT